MLELAAIVKLLKVLAVRMMVKFLIYYMMYLFAETVARLKPETGVAEGLVRPDTDTMKV